MSAETSLKTRIMTGYALCAIAERQIHAGELEGALKTVRAIREMVAEMTALLDGPHQHTHSAIREAREALIDLETRIRTVEATLPAAG